MRISSTQLSRPSVVPQTPQSPPSESSSFLNEPHIPMDSVMRGFEQFELSSTAKETLTMTAIGAVGGALGGAFGGESSMIPMTALTTAGLGATTAAVHSIATDGPGYNMVGSLMAGMGYGGFGGVLGYGLQSLTGLPPVIAGAITGAGMGFVGAAVMQRS